MKQEIKLSSLKEFESLASLAQELFGVSRNLLKRYDLHKKDKKVHPKQEVSLPLDIVNHLVINPIYEGPKIKVLAEDERMIFLDKPAGIHCHPLSYCESDNCLSFLRSRAHKIETFSVNPTSYDRGLLYRLDQVTSGVLCVVKDSELFHQLRDNFSDEQPPGTLVALGHGLDTLRRQELR